MSINWKKERIELQIFFTYDEDGILIDYESIEDDLKKDFETLEKEKNIKIHI